MVRNSVGNVVEILDLLDSKKYSELQLAENYALLVEKWGEWEIVGAGTAGLVIRYVDVGSALFSGLMMTFCTLTVISFVCALLFGKVVLPLMTKHYECSNRELVDLSTLRSAAQIDKLSKKEWF